MKDAWEPPSRRYNDEDEDEEEEADEDEIEDEADRDAEAEGDTTDSWDKDAEEGNEVNPADGLQDLQYFPNFYRLLSSLDSGESQRTAASLESLHSSFLFILNVVLFFCVCCRLQGGFFRSENASICLLSITACAATRAAGMLESVPAVVLNLGHVPVQCSTSSGFKVNIQ